MEYWTVLIVTILGGPMDGIQTGMIYPSEVSCREAVNQVTETLPYDYRVDCVVSDTPSSSISPRQRPEGLGG